MTEQTLLRDRQFLRYVGARGLSVLGTITTLIALQVLVYRLTGSASTTALVAALEAARRTWSFGLVAGALTDRWNRRRVMVTADLVGAVLLASGPGGRTGSAC